MQSHFENQIVLSPNNSGFLFKLIQNCLHLIKPLISYILQVELMKLVKKCGFSTQIPKDSVFDKNCKNDTNTLYYTHDYTRHVFI